MPDTQVPSPQGLLANAALAYGGTGAYPQVQKSQYLADAIRSLQQGSASNIQTKGALASNLLADAILQFSRGRNNADLMNDIGQGQSTQMANAQQGAFGSPDAQGAAGGASGGAPVTAAPPSQPAPAAAPGGPPSGPQLAAAITGGPPPAAAPAGNGPQLAAAITGAPAPGAPRLSGSAFFNDFFVPHEGRLNKSDANGTPSVYGLNEKANPDVSANMTQAQVEPLFEQRYFDASGANNMQPALAAIHADTYALNPSWAKNILQQSGGDPSKYMALRTQYMQNDLAQNPAVRPYAHAWANRNRDLMAYAAQVGGGQQQAPQAQPYQVASNGPTPPPPMNSLGVPAATPQTQGGPFPPPPPAPGPSAGVPVGGAVPNVQPAQQGQGGPPTGPFASPGERQYIQWAAQQPRGSAAWIAGLQKAQEIQQRAMTPMEPPKDMMWGPDGVARPMPGTQVQQMAPTAPGERSQVDRFGQVTDSAVPNAVQNGQVFDQASGGYKPLPGLQPQTSGNFTAGTVTSQTPGSAPTVVQAPVFDPEKVRQAFLSDPAVTKFNDVRTSLQGFAGAVQQAAGNNGVLDEAGVNSVLQAMMPGANPRTTTNEHMINHLGLPDALFGGADNAFGKGFITPESLKQLAGVAWQYGQAQQQSAQQRMQSDTAAGGPAYAKGVPGESVPPLPAMPSFQALNGQPQHAPAGNAQQLIQDARQAILRGAPRAAVAQRLQSMGVNPAGL